jgi:hypothetical protein
MEGYETACEDIGKLIGLYKFLQLSLYLLTLDARVMCDASRDIENTLIDRN